MAHQPTSGRLHDRLLQDVIDGSPAIIFLKDLEGRYVTVNRRLEALLGMTREELRGKTDFDLFPRHRAEHYRAHDREVIESGKHVEVEEIADLADGKRHVFLSHKFPVFDEDGRMNGVCGISHDLTDHLAVAEALRDANERLRVHVETMPLGVVEWDADYRVKRMSPRAEQILGWTAAEVVGRRIDEIPWVAPEDWPSVRAVMADMSSGARPANVNANRNLRADGTVIHCEWYNSTTHDAAGHLVSVLSLVLDVTERTRAAEAADRTEAALAQAGGMAHLGAWWIDVTDPGNLNASPLRWSDEVYRLFGYAPGEVAVSNELFFAHVHPDDRHRVTAAVATALAANRPYTVEHRIVRRDGVERVVLEHGEARRDEQGRLVRIVGAVQDVTEQKRREAELRANEAQLRRYADLVEHAPVLVRNLDGEISAWNRGMEELYGWTRSEVLGRVSHDVLCTRFPLPVSEITRRVIEKGRWQGEVVHRRRDGSDVTIASLWILHPDRDGLPDAIIEVNHDITRLKLAEAALRDADRRKDEFLATLSHELRNPLAPIRNSTYVLRHAEPGSEQARRAQAVIERQTQHLTRLVDDLLDLTRIAHGKIELRPERLDLREVVRRTAEDFRRTIEEKGVTLNVAVPGTAVWVEVDATRMAQLIGNLLHNAAKFTRNGDEVLLSLVAAADSAEIGVRDSGTGIDPDLLPSLFEPFVQGDRSLARTEGGLGLGLALVKGIAELHGGSVAAGSAGRGTGAEFTVRVPLAAPVIAEARRGRSSPASMSERRVLIVEDNVDGAQSLADLVKVLGHEVEIAHDGATALARAKANPPDVVLCDIGLPGMNGYEVAQALRAMRDHDLQLVAVTGYAQPEDVERAFAAGFDAHVPKPCDPEQIRRLLG